MQAGVGLSSVGDDTSSVGDNAVGWWAQTTPVANAQQRVQSFFRFSTPFQTDGGVDSDQRPLSLSTCEIDDDDDF